MEVIDGSDIIYRRVRVKDPNYWDPELCRPEAYAFRREVLKDARGKRLQPIAHEAGLSVDIKGLGGTALLALGDRAGRQAIVSLEVSECRNLEVDVLADPQPTNQAHGLIVGGLTDEDLERCDKLAKLAKVEIDAEGKICV